MIIIFKVVMCACDMVIEVINSSTLNNNITQDTKVQHGNNANLISRHRKIMYSGYLCNNPSDGA
jgi:hypothetical protein